MRVRLKTAGTVLPGAALFLTLASPETGLAQFAPARPCLPPQYQAPACEPPPPDSTSVPQPPTAPQEPTLSPEAFAATGGGESFAAQSPNMVGNLLDTSRSVAYTFVRAGNANVAATGSTTTINPNIADNNSPVPQDRIAFRYNHYQDSQTVTGLSNPVTGPFGVPTNFGVTRDYNVDQYTLTLEKTFLDRRMSIQADVPFATALSTNNVVASDKFLGFTGAVDAGGRAILNLASTPQNTFGHYSTQFGNIGLILKGAVIQRPTLVFSVGAGLTIPTAPSTNLRVIDDGGNATSGSSVQRVRDIHIDNDTFIATPFLATLWTPNDRWFNMGFLSFELPLNADQIRYSDGTAQGSFFAPISFAGGNRQVPFTTYSSITDQPLMHLDLGTGFWALRDPGRRWLTGIAPMMELHYTDTLRPARNVQLPGDGSGGLNPANPAGPPVLEQGPVVGNFFGRTNYLDATVATTFLISNRATLAFGCAFPLLSSPNRTFDWEAMLQLNWYFGSSGPGLRAPNL